MPTLSARSTLSLLVLAGMSVARAQSWIETRASIETLAESGDPEAALALGDELLNGVGDVFGETSPELAESHLLLAEIYYSVGDAMQAETQTASAIRIIEGNEGSVATSLIRPYTQLGDTFLLGGTYDLAIEAYDLARAIGRREFGLLNQDQLSLLDRMSLAALRMGDYKLAQDFQEDRLHIVGRHHGLPSLEYLEAAFGYASWLRSWGAEDDARFVYSDVEKIIDDNRYADVTLSVRRLQMMSANYPYRTVPPIRPKPEFLLEALELLDEVDTPYPELEAAVLLDLGDWYLREGRVDADFQGAYRQAWDLLAQVENGERLRFEWFSNLTVISAAPLYSPLLSDDAQAAEGFITLEFDVDVDGRARNIRVIDSDPIGLIDDPAITRISRSIFRPGMDDGELGPATSTFTMRFRYLPDEGEIRTVRWEP